MISLSDSFATVVPIGNSLSASSRGRGCARFEIAAWGRGLLGMWSLWIMDEKAHKWSQDEGEFDAVLFLSRNGTQGEAGVGLKPLSVPKFRMLLFA